ncbi:MAG: hypothetical protein HY901_07935 [Deltaproteobacteria bacterium]|nr:hypothetical protein [Deltaproteobacteria bacterium]
MKSNFVPHPNLAGDGRCRICDFAYSTLVPAEVAQHRRYHARYLAACGSVGAPMPTAERESRRQAGLAVQFNERIPLRERIAAAERWLEAEHHDHLAEVLLYGVQRLDLREYFTKHVEPSRLSSFENDVAAELRLRYSDSFVA